MSNINPFIHEFTVDLRNGVTMERAKKPLSQGDAFANKIVVHVLKDGQTVPLDGVAVSASVIRYDGATVPLTGTVEEGAACIVLNDECYAVPGDLLVSVVLAVGEVKQTILRLMLNVETSQTDIIADGGVIGSFSQLLAEIENMRSATAAAISAAERAEAAADRAENAGGTGGTGGNGTSAPAYVIEEADRVANAVREARTTKSLVLLCASDIHTLQSNAQSVETTLHLAQGISEIYKRVAVDGIAILGDSAYGSSTSTAEETKFAFAHLRENLVKGADEIWIPGNHDHFGISDDGSYLSADELYSYIGANTTDKAVTDYDNLHRMYGYVDYDKQRIRVVYLNTSDITDSYASDYGMSTVQAQWLADTLAAVPSGWGAVVLSHHPLNGYISAYLGTLTILDAYKGKQSGSVTVGGGAVTYDFSNAQGELICHLHGHIHNYQVATFGSNKVLSVTIPNGCFDRNNEYGTGGNADWGDEVDGVQRVINKTAGTAEDTAYTAVVIDRKHGKVHALRCGAGIDRVWDYINGVEVETPDEPVEPDEPDTPPTGYTNQIPLSVGTDGKVYNGTGYKAGYRLSTSSGNESAAAGMSVTGFIPVNPSSVVRVQDIDMTSGESTYAIYNSSFAKAASGYCNSDWTAADANGVRTYTLNGSTNFAYIRVSGAFGANPIVTVDENIG